MLSQFSGKSSNNMLSHTSEFKCTRNVYMWEEIKIRKVRELTSSAFTKKVTKEGSSPKLH